MDMPAFFTKAIKQLGFTLFKKEPRRYHLPYVPVRIRQNDRVRAQRGTILHRYARITLDHRGVGAEDTELQGEPAGL